MRLIAQPWHSCSSPRRVAMTTTTSGGGDGDTTDAPAAQDEIGEGEGAVSILAWPYYAEDGTFTDGLDWVTAFEEETGCDATVKYFGTVRRGLHARSAPATTTWCRRRVTRRCAASPTATPPPINTDLIEHYDDLAPFLKEQAQQLASTAPCTASRTAGAPTCCSTTPRWSTRRPTSWSAVFDADSPYAGKIAAYDSPDLHRRRGGVPDGDAARPRASRTRTPSTRSSSTPPSTC